MTSITWKNLKTGKSKIEFFRSKDKLEKTLQLLSYDLKRKIYLRIIKQKNKIVAEETIGGISYEEENELEIFRKYKLLPQKDEYPNG